MAQGDEELRTFVESCIEAWCSGGAGRVSDHDAPLGPRALDSAKPATR
jgi:hypothetical protein